MTLDELKERQFQKGFTLTELLLAMVIIGVVAALTIPALIANINRKNWISGIKKSYTVMAEGLKQAEALNGKASTWGEENFIENLMSGFKVMKECNGTSCLPNEQFLNGEAFSVGDGTVKSFVLADGSSVVATMLSSECDQSVGSLEGICGTLYVDVDGEKGPNTMGKDFFGFYVTQTGVIPYGSSKIDTVEPGYNWVSKGCHSGDPVCAEGKFFSCSNASGNQTVCNTCGGDWRTYTQQAYSEPVYRTDISSYKIVSYNVVYKSVSHPGHTAHGSACTRHAAYHAAYTSCNSYSRGDCAAYSGYTCAYYYYYCSSYTYHPASGGECTSYAYYVSPKTTYAYNYSTSNWEPGTYNTYVASYKYFPKRTTTSCDGASGTYSVCFGYKYPQEWDCWHNPQGVAHDDPCNASGTASKKSCNFKTYDALGDCNLDDKGTSCGAWAIMNDNMNYLDGKEVEW